MSYLNLTNGHQRKVYKLEKRGKSAKYKKKITNKLDAYHTTYLTQSMGTPRT